MDPQKSSSYREQGLGMASIVAVASFGLMCLSLGGLFANVDSRLILYSSQTFSDLAMLRDIFNKTVNYTVIDNPQRVDHVSFPSSPETLEELQDIQSRGLLAGVSLDVLFKPVTAPDPNLLHRLMLASWCSSGPPLPNNKLPAQRTRGCKCIADAYLDFVNSSLPVGAAFYQASYVLVNQTATRVLVNGTNTTVWVNGTNTTVMTPVVINVSQAIRDRVGSRVYRCWDQRQVTRSRTCGNLCKTHVIGLALFADIVLFLTSVTFLVFYSRLPFTWNLFTLKLLVVLLAVVVSIPYFVRYPEANSINVAAIIVCVLYLIIGLHEELDRFGMEAKFARVSQIVSSGQSATPIPSPFMVCILVTLPLTLSSHTLQLGVSGYGRDVWALFSFGLCGGLLGLLLQVLSPSCFFPCFVSHAGACSACCCRFVFFLCVFLFIACVTRFFFLQRYFWASYYVSSDPGDPQDMARLGRAALAGAYVCVQVLLIVLYFAYRYDNGPYAGGNPYVFFLYQGFLTLLIAILGYDHEERIWRTNALDRTVPGFTAMQNWFVVLLLVACGSMSVIAFSDVSQHPS